MLSRQQKASSILSTLKKAGPTELSPLGWVTMWTVQQIGRRPGFLSPRHKLEEGKEPTGHQGCYNSRLRSHPPTPFFGNHSILGLQGPHGSPSQGPNLVHAPPTMHLPSGCLCFHLSQPYPPSECHLFIVLQQRQQDTELKPQKSSLDNTFKIF